MKRTTINLPDDLYALLERERKRRDVSATAVVREALERYLLAPEAPREIEFIGIGRSDGDRIGERIEELMRDDARSEEGYNRMMFGTPTRPEYAKPTGDRSPMPDRDTHSEETNAGAGSV